MIPSHRPYLGRAELDAVARVFESRWLGMGEVTSRFEDALRAFLGARHVVAVNTGTSALHLALHALDLRPGDEVVVPSLTFVASVQAILAAGTRPVFCEVRPDTLTMDMDDVRRRITDRTRALIPVHFAGLACDMDALLSLAQEGNLRVVEDAAHAFGSTYRGRKIGTLGDVTCFSFDPIKNITCGEGGALATDDDALARRILPARNVGISADSWSRAGEERYWHYEVVGRGYRYHMSNLNAAVGLEQLARLEAFKLRKQSIVRSYDSAFNGVDGLVLVRRDLDETFPFSYLVRVPAGRRDALIRHLQAHGVKPAVEYIPNHLQPGFADFRQPLPVTEQLYSEIVSLPLYYEMTDADVDVVVGAVKSFFAAIT